MTQGQITNIGSKQNYRHDSKVADISKVQGLKKILDQDFESWSNFDNWHTNRRAAQFVFSKAMSAYKGNNIDVRCDCCDYIGSSPKDLILKRKGLSCYGSKTVYIILEVLDEIKEAKKARDNGGTYAT